MVGFDILSNADLAGRRGLGTWRMTSGWKLKVPEPSTCQAERMTMPFSVLGNHSRRPINNLIGGSLSIAGFDVLRDDLATGTLP